MTLARAAGAALLLAGAAAALSRRPPDALSRFPIGLYGVASADDLSAIKEAGFDSFFPEPANQAGLESLARRARSLGLRMILAPAPFRAHPVSAVSRWPIAAWSLADEPEVNGLSPEALIKEGALTRAWDPGRPQVFSLGSGAAAERYARLGDAVLLDWYPVPHLELDSVADQIDAARRFLPADKPLWMIVQAFDWRDEPSASPGKPAVGRFPTYAEIRFMSYLALVHGARGLFYFRFSKNGGTLLDYPELWQGVWRVTRQLKSLQPILELGQGAGRGVSAVGAGIESRAWRYRGRTYLVLVNRARTPVSAPDMIMDGSWRPLFEEKRDMNALLLKTTDGHALAPRQVLVLESRFRLFRPQAL